MNNSENPSPSNKEQEILNQKIEDQKRKIQREQLNGFINQLNEQEIKEEVSKIIESKDQLNIKDIGKIMGELKTKFSGRMDFGKASEIVKALLK